jgi:hypothetical protein
MDAAGSRMWAIGILSALFFLAVLYLLAVGPYWKISPDSVSYVSAGVSLASGKGYTSAGMPVQQFPPMTSLMFSIPLLLFPGRYLALNALVTTFTLLAHIVCFVLLRKRVDSVRAAIPVLLSLGSIVMFHNSTRLLSDICYLFLSTAALVVAEHISGRDSGWGGHLLLAIIVLMACMTRIAGVTLVAAVVFHRLISPRRKEGRLRLVVLMSVAALVVALWEVRSLRLGTSYLKLALQNEPYVDEAGYASPLRLLRRFYHHLDEYWAIGGILTNGMLSGLGVGRGLIGLPARGTLLALFCFGLAHSIRRGMTVTDVYCAIYLLAAGAWVTGLIVRYAVPVVPLLFHYALVGGHAIVEQARRRLGPLASRVAYVGLLVYVACFLRAGVAGMRWAIPREHSSPFGAYPIKYTWNYDTQRLAMWLRDHSGPGDRYVCQHPNVTQYFSEREGYSFPFSTDAGQLLDLLEGHRVRYVLADKKKAEVQQFLLPAIKAHPDQFSLIREEENASLYEFELRP